MCDPLFIIIIIIIYMKTSIPFIQELSVLALALLLVLAIVIPLQTRAEIATDDKAALESIVSENKTPEGLLEIINYLYQAYNLNAPKQYGNGNTTTSSSVNGVTTAGADPVLCEKITEITINQYVGTENQQVSRLQQFFNLLANRTPNYYQPVSRSGYGSYGNESNYFGPATRDAVSRWQQRNMNIGTSSYGHFGPQTRITMREIYCNGNTSTAGTLTPGATTKPVSPTRSTKPVVTTQAPVATNTSSEGVVLSLTPVTSISEKNVYAKTITGMQVGQVCVTKLYRYYVIDLGENAASNSNLAEAALSSTYGLYYEGYNSMPHVPGGPSYIKVKEDVTFRLECNDGTNSNFVGVKFDSTPNSSSAAGATSGNTATPSTSNNLDPAATADLGEAISRPVAKLWVSSIDGVSGGGSDTVTVPPNSTVHVMWTSGGDSTTKCFAEGAWSSQGYQGGVGVTSWYPGTTSQTLTLRCENSLGTDSTSLILNVSS